MAGCYGSSQEDQHFERELNKYLDSTEETVCCGSCNWTGLKEELMLLIPDDITEVCPVCNGEELEEI